MLPRFALLIAVATIPATAEIEIRSADHPKAFFFRNAEGFAHAGKMEYQRWDSVSARNVRLLPAGVDDEELTKPKSHMTWLNETCSGDEAPGPHLPDCGRHPDARGSSFRSNYQPLNSFGW